jgi:hypothetical protein
MNILTLFEFIHHNLTSGVCDIVGGVLLRVGWGDDRHEVKTIGDINLESTMHINHNELQYR